MLLYTDTNRASIAGNTLKVVSEALKPILTEVTHFLLLVQILFVPLAITPNPKSVCYAQFSKPCCKQVNLPSKTLVIAGYRLVLVLVRVLVLVLVLALGLVLEQ